MDIVIKSLETRDGVQFRVLKDNEFKFYTIPFNNYFYIRSTDFNSSVEDFSSKFKFCIKDVEIVGNFTKIILSNNFMRHRVREFWEERCQTYEADIKANKRFLLNNNIPLNNTKIPYSFYDIETDDRKPLIKDERGRVIPDSRILSFAGTDNKGESVYFELKEETDESEIELLNEIIDYFSKYGIISGWYSEFFDMPFIKGRCDKFGISYAILEFINHLDYKDIFQKYDRKSRPSYSLNAISNEILSESKLDQDKGNGAIYNTWLNNKEHLKKYNIEDTNLIYKINKKRMFIEVSMKRADNSGCHVRSTVNNSDSGDYLLMRAYNKEKIIMPSQPTKAEMKERAKQGAIGGGYTTCFDPGYHERVDIFDFKCIDPETIVASSIGFRKIKDLKVGDFVFNDKGKFPILEKAYTEHNSYLKITLDTGDFINCSKEHRFPTYEGLKKAEELDCTDRLYTGQQYLFTDIDDEYIIKTIRVLGLFLAEGSLLGVGKSNDKPYYSLRWSLHKKEKYLEKMLYDYFIENFNYTPRTYYKGANGMRVVVTSKEIFYHFNSLMSELPKLLMHRNLATEYVKYFMEGDGSYNISRETIQASQSMQNKGKMKLIYDLIIALGVPCRFFKTYAKIGDRKFDIYKIEIRQVEKYLAKIGFVTKECKFDYKNKKHHLRGYIKSIETINEVMEMIDIKVGNVPYFYGNNILTHNSEYPSVIQTWNISPETYIETIHSDKDAEQLDKTEFIVTPSDFEGIFHPSRVYKKEEGVIPKVVRWLVEERDKIKYTMHKYKKDAPDKYTQLFLEQYCFHPDTKIVTKDGIKFLKEVKVGELVYSINPTTLEIELKPVTDVYQRHYKGKMFHYKSKLYEIKTTENHKYLVTKNYRDFKEIQAKEFDGNRYSIPLHKKMFFNRPIDAKNVALSKLVGWYISEGYISETISNDHPVVKVRNLKCAICQSFTANPIYYQEIRTILQELNINFTETKKQDRFYIKDLKIINFLRQFGHNSHTKILYTDWVYNESCEKSIQETLYKGDGSKNQQKYSTVSKKLAEDYLILMYRLGYRATLTQRTNKSKCYVIRHSKVKGWKIRPNNYKWEEYDGLVYNLTVADNHTVLVSNGSGFLWTKQSLKTDSNSIYGILGFPASRYYSWELGDSVTTCARATLKHCNKMIIENLKAVVIGGDTDSTFIKLPEDVSTEKADTFFIEILKAWGEKWGCINNKLIFEYEKTFDKMLFVKKKHYAYIIKDEITIKGLEAIKSDSNKLAARLQREFIEDVLLGNYVEKNWEMIVEKLYDKVFDLKMNTEELALIKALTKMPKDYEGYVIDKKTGKPKIKNDGELQKKAIPAHVKLAERLIAKGQDINPGSKIKFIVIKDKPILAISPAEYERGSGVFEYKHKKTKDIINYEWEGDYATKYYWLRIMKPLIKVIYSYYKALPEWGWNLSDTEKNKILATQERDDEDD